MVVYPTNVDKCGSLILKGSDRVAVPVPLICSPTLLLHARGDFPQTRMSKKTAWPCAHCTAPISEKLGAGCASLYCYTNTWEFKWPNSCQTQAEALRPVVVKAGATRVSCGDNIPFGYVTNSCSGCFTTSTGHGASRMIFSAVDPKTKCLSPVRPWVASVIKSTSSSLAVLTISL